MMNDAKSEPSGSFAIPFAMPIPPASEEVSKMMNGASSEQDPVLDVASEIRSEVEDLKREASSMRDKHQFYTVITILLGVAAPAIVTYTPPVDFEFEWKIFAIIITAFATASATIRTVLRYSERYNNSALTAIALEDLWAELNAKRQEVLVQVKEEYRNQKLYEYSAWARKEMYSIKKTYVEKEVSAITKERVELTPPPPIAPDQKSDPTLKTSKDL
jgi:hypothetical protein